MKLRVTENQCVLFDSFTYIIPSCTITALSTLCQGRLYPHTYIYVYIYRGSKLGLFWLVAMASREKTFGNEFRSKFATTVFNLKNLKVCLIVLYQAVTF